MYKIILLGIFSLNLFAGVRAPKNFEMGQKVVEYNWNGIEVVWLENSRFPVFDIVFYFADGSLSDEKSELGVTSFMFSGLKSGTSKLNQSQIATQFEYFGTTFGASVIHERSSVSMSGLVQNLEPSMKLACEIFKNARFPKAELNKSIKRSLSGLQNLVTSPGRLADRSFREISLRGTPFDIPTSGRMNDIKALTSLKLQNKLAHFSKNVKKKIYISGPKSALKIKDIILNECGFAPAAKFVRLPPKTKWKNPNRGKIVLVTVPKANQAQIRIGQILPGKLIAQSELSSLTSHFLGGGFTSILNKELRVKQGLTYSVGSFVGHQRDYGRSGISTFTKVKTVKKMIVEIKKILNRIKNGKFDSDRFLASKEGLAGAYAFSFEKNNAYLDQLLYFDHVGKSRNEFFKFPEKILAFDSEDVQNGMKSAFDWDDMVVVVLGEKSLIKELRKIGPVTVVNYKRYL